MGFAESLKQVIKSNIENCIRKQEFVFPAG